MAKKKAAKKTSVSKEEQSEASKAILEKFKEDVDRANETVVELPKEDPIKKEAHTLQRKLRGNQFRQEYKEVKVSKDLLKYFEDNRLDRYNQTLIAG